MRNLRHCREIPSIKGERKTHRKCSLRKREAEKVKDRDGERKRVKNQDRKGKREARLAALSVK